MYVVSQSLSSTCRLPFLSASGNFFENCCIYVCRSWMWTDPRRRLDRHLHATSRSQYNNGTFLSGLDRGVAALQSRESFHLRWESFQPLTRIVPARPTDTHHQRILSEAHFEGLGRSMGLSRRTVITMFMPVVLFTSDVTLRAADGCPWLVFTARFLVYLRPLLSLCHTCVLLGTIRNIVARSYNYQNLFQ